MASTWSALKVELQGTGDNSGSWGTLTNANLGDAVLGEAITGSATVDFASDADVTITLTDFATTQAARNLRLNITESSTGIGSVRNLILGSGCQIEKFYLINNTGTGAKTIKNTSGTGISVPAGKATLVFNNGTNVVDAASYFTSLTLGSALPVASGGTSLATLTANNVILGNGTSAPLFVAPSTSGNVLTSNGTTWASTAPAAGTTFSAGTTGFTPSTATSGAVTLAGTLAVANGGTGQTTYTNGQLLIGNTTGNTLTKATLTQGTGITITNSTGAITVANSGVTSVGGTGTVNGLSLSGTVTTTGNLTLGGTLSSVANSALTNSSVTVTAGTGMSGGGAVALGSSITLTNAGVTSIVAGTGISVSGATGAVTVTNTVSGGKAADVQTFTSSGTWTKPSGFGADSRVQIEVWGAGGAGGTASSSTHKVGGGGGGGYIERWIALSSLGSTETVTIGAGGTATSQNNAGGSGGDSSLGSIAIAYGGGGGYGMSFANISGGGGGGGQISAGLGGSNGEGGRAGRPYLLGWPRDSAGTKLSVSTTAANALSFLQTQGGAGFGVSTTAVVIDSFTHGGGGGSVAFSSCTSFPSTGADSIYGGAGGGSSGGGTARAGGTSLFGGNGGTGSTSTGTAGTAPGGGGGGSANGSGASGAVGRIIITVFDGT